MPKPRAGLNPQVLGGAIINEAMSHDNLEWLRVMKAAHNINEMINIDPKTELLNEQAYRRALGETIKSLGEGDELYVGGADIDGLKSINDALGHAKGDEFLGIVGGIFQSVYKRGGGIAPPDAHADNPENIARFGGDEFGFFWVERQGEAKQSLRSPSLEESSQRQAERANQILQQTIAGTEFAGCKPALSTAVVKYEASDTVDSLMTKADIAMYENKYAPRRGSLTKQDIRWLSKAIPRIEAKGARMPDWMKQEVAARVT